VNHSIGKKLNMPKFIALMTTANVTIDRTYYSFNC